MPDDIKLPPRPEPDGYLIIQIIGRDVEVNAYRDSTMDAYARAAVEADRVARSPAANVALARKMGAAHLSDPEMADVLADLKRRIKTEPGFKRALLQSAGIVNEDGSLTPLYRGGDAEAAHGITEPKGGSDA
jgi:hypothetical protein